jgi:prepilin-type N-terminal cleavage/methylation domain-containing protein
MKRGFTLVEIIVVIVIVAILSLVGTSQYVNIQQRSADNERQSDILQLTSALEQYYRNNGEYPRYFDLRDNGPTLLKLDKNAFISPGDTFTSTTVPSVGNGANQYGTSLIPLAYGTQPDETKVYRYWVPGENSYPSNFTPPDTTAVRNTFIILYKKEEGANSASNAV